MQNANLSQEMPQEERSRTIPDTPLRSAELAVAPADIIERAAQRLDWTIAFGMRHNTPRVEGTTNELSKSDPPRVRWTSRLRFSRVGLTPLPAISLLCFMSVLAAVAAGASIFMLTQPPREKATAESAPAEEALATTSEATSSSEGLAMAHHAADAVENAALAGPVPTPAESGAEPAPASITATGGPEPKVAVTPAGPALEATSTIASPEPQKTPTLPTLSAAEIADLLARGDWWFATGDVASARLFYERAAGVGEARAAVKLGETFDPAFLGRLNLRGVRADPGMALFWYRRARDLGASDAASRLIGLEAKQGALR